MSRNMTRPDDSELEQAVRDALDDVDEPNGYSDLPNLSVSTDDDGNVRVRALEKRRNKRNVHRNQKDALDAAGLSWELKDDARFSNGKNPRVVVVTGFEDPTAGVFEEVADPEEFVEGLDEDRAEGGQFSYEDVFMSDGLDVPGETTLYEARPFDDTSAFRVRLTAEPSWISREDMCPEENRLICVFLWVEVTYRADEEESADLHTRNYLHYSPERSPRETVEEAKDLARRFGQSYEDALRMANSPSNEDRRSARPEEWVEAFEEEREARNALGLDDDEDGDDDSAAVETDGGEAEIRADGGEDPVGYAAVTSGNVAPMFCLDCGPDVNRETEPMFSEDMEAFDTATCAGCEVEFYPPSEDREITPVEAKFVLPDGHYYGRTVPGGPWHIFDDDERRSLCGIYNDDGVTRGSNRGLDDTDLPDGVCGSCVGNAPYLELVREEESGSHD